MRSTGDELILLGKHKIMNKPKKEHKTWDFSLKCWLCAQPPGQQAGIVQYFCENLLLLAMKVSPVLRDQSTT
jgi:hypothetical protein